ncbi:MAG: AAA family ATPase [Eubacteriales bacterium]|nr:AAA family ATPase [Eubacteriales bacterium]
MNISEAKKEIINTVKAYLLKDEEGKYKIPEVRQRPILLMGPPGIGKTQIMEQIAAECNIGLVSYTITHHTRQSAVGLPMIDTEEYDGHEYSVTKYTMSEIIAGVYNAIRDEGKKEGILFIDEINCVSETLIPTMLQFLQCKTFGNQKIPEGWIIVAAGNPPEYNRSVREFDMVTLDRVRKIDIEANLNVWKEYATKKNIHGAILSYLDIRPGNFYKIEAEAEGISFVTARGWEDLGALCRTYEELSIPFTYETIREYLQNDDVAEDFSAYYELYNKYKDDYKVDDILNGSASSEVYRRIENAQYDERIALVHLILDSLSIKLANGKNVRKSVDDRYKEIKEIYSDKNSDEYKAEKEKFLVAAGKADELEDSILDKINNSIKFVEENLEWTELLVLITGLTMGKDSSMFLLEHQSDDYIRLSNSLVNGNKKIEIMKELENN